MPETTPLIKAALNLRVGAGFDVYEKAYVLSVANMEQEGSVVYLPIYMCYLLKERKIGKLIVDLDMEGL